MDDDIDTVVPIKDFYDRQFGYGLYIAGILYTLTRKRGFVAGLGCP